MAQPDPALGGILGVDLDALTRRHGLDPAEVARDAAQHAEALRRLSPHRRLMRETQPRRVVHGDGGHHTAQWFNHTDREPWRLMVTRDSAVVYDVVTTRPSPLGACHHLHASGAYAVDECPLPVQPHSRIVTRDTGGRVISVLETDSGCVSLRLSPDARTLLRLVSRDGWVADHLTLNGTVLGEYDAHARSRLGFTPDGQPRVDDKPPLRLGDDWGDDE